MGRPAFVVSYGGSLNPNPTFFLVFTIAQGRARRGRRDEKKMLLICHRQ